MPRHQALPRSEGDTQGPQGDECIFDQLGILVRHLEQLSKIDSTWLEHVEYLQDVLSGLQELSSAISRALVDVSEEPEDLEKLQERLAQIQRLCRKYGVDLDGLIEKREKLKGIISSIEDGSLEIERAKKNLELVRKRLTPVLRELSRERSKSAEKLDKLITKEIRSVGIKGADFETRIRSAGEEIFTDDKIDSILTPRGWDRVEFFIRTNVGEDMHPLSEIVSGGELSRITLILKKIFVEAKNIPTLIFDEIDTGLGADLGEVVAEKLAQLSNHYQVICITHLPQVASKADQHIRVDKRVEKGRTVTTASTLSDEERVEELARMLGGQGDLQRKLASEMLIKGESARSSAG